MEAFLISTGIVALAEMGDKTQVATVMLAARHQAWIAVVAGTTLGMMLANAPVVWFGERVTRRVPIRMVHSFRPCSSRASASPRWCGADIYFAGADLLQLAGAQ